MTPNAAERFTERLATATGAAHRDAEESEFVGNLLAGKLAASAYAAMLGQNHLIYETLERRTADLAGSVVDRVHTSALIRAPHLAADLRFLTGPTWEARIDELPATRRYRDRIEQVADGDPRIFIAHHYIRYLGDLSGGQIIKSMLRQAYGYTDEGVRFYTFADIPKLKPFKDSYRAALDALDLAPAAEALFIAEVNDAYAFNRAVFDELGAAFGRHTP